MKIKRKRSQMPENRSWDLYRDGITQGLLQRFLACPERHRLALQERLEPLGAGSPSREFGTIVHNALEFVYGNSVPDHPLRKLDLTLSAQEETLREDIRQMKSTPGNDPFQELEENLGLARVILRSYIDHWDTDFGRLEWLELEKTFNHSIPAKTINPYARGERIPVQGKRDGLFRSKSKKSGFTLFETKTKARIEEDRIMDVLSYDLQVMLYLWSIWLDYGEVPQGVLYNVIRRPQLKQKVSESLPQFLKRIEDDIEERRDFYFKRFSVLIMKSELEDWIPHFHGMVSQLIDWDRGTFHYRNSGSCLGQKGTCEFLAICGRNDRTGFKHRAEFFPELKGDD